MTPRAKLEGRERAVFAERDHRLEAAREQRKQRRSAARKEVNRENSCVFQPPMAD